MTDYYKILNIPFGASETEIKKRFRKLASIHHPDKNGGSKKSEDIFKTILNAYETLSNKESRRIYDLKYTQQFQKPKSEPTTQNNTNSNTNKETTTQTPPKYKEYRQAENTKVNYGFWIIIAVIILFYLYNANKTTTTGNPKADKQLEEQQMNRPQSGELEFKK